jgi:Pentapeptide repeats (8 copies)
MARAWKVAIRIARRIGSLVVVAALLGGASWLWLQLRAGSAVNWDDPSVVALIISSIAVVLWGIWWLWWRLPQRQVARLALKIRDPKARADTEDNFRKTVGQALGGAAVLIGAGAAYLQFTQQQQAAHDLLISNQVSKGFEQLAGDKVPMRLGGIYALEGVMNGSQQYHQPVLEALCAFVRDGTIGNDKAVGTKPATDIQAALTVLGRRGDGDGWVDLAKANIQGANLRSADLTGADLSGANLRSAGLHRANLTGANLSGADLRYADLSGAHLDGADLTGADLAQAQLDQACGKPRALPPGLTLDKPCPPPPVPAAPAGH